MTGAPPTVSGVRRHSRGGAPCGAAKNLRIRQPFVAVIGRWAYRYIGL